MTKKRTGGVKLGHDGGGIRTLDDLKNRCFIDDDECWIWRLSCQGGKYPKVYLASHGTCIAGVKAALVLSGVEMIPGKTGYHYKCSNTKCCNPDHLKYGTHKQKWAHIKSAGFLRGDPLRKAVNSQVRRSSSHLTPHVAEIRASDEDNSQIAKRLNCLPETIRDIRAFKTHLPEVPNSSVFTWRPAA